MIENKEAIRKYSICAVYDNKIYKFKVTTNSSDIDYLIEEYLNSLDIYLFEVVDEKSLENKEVAEKFFPYLGKFRLEGKIKSTHNYFAPINQGNMLSILFSLYKTNILNEKDFKCMNKLYSTTNDSNILNLIKQIFCSADIELIEECTLEDLNTHLNSLEKLFSEIKFNEIYISLKELLESSKENREIINKLDLNDYFIKAITSKEKVDEIQLTKKHN